LEMRTKKGLPKSVQYIGDVPRTFSTHVRHPDDEVNDVYVVYDVVVEPLKNVLQVVRSPR